MANFDRSKFKAAKLVDLEKQKKDLEAKRPKGNGGNVDYVDLSLGSNLVRIYPTHPEGKSYIYQKCTSWLPFYKENEDGKKELARRPIFNAKIHANAEKDIIEEYVAAAKQMYADKEKSGEMAAAEVKEKIDFLYHFKTGIWPKTQWVVYAEVSNDKGTKFGRLELGNGIKSKLDELSMSEDPNDVMATDPFTDPDSGFRVRIDKADYKKVQAQDVYKCTLLYQKPYPLSDEDLEQFAAVTPLKKMFADSYKSKDFEKAIESLEIYDTENEIGVFSECPDFLDVCEEQAALYPEENPAEDNIPRDANGEEDKSTDELPFDKPDVEAKRKANMAAKKEVEESAPEPEEESEPEAEEFPDKLEGDAKMTKAEELRAKLKARTKK